MISPYDDSWLLDAMPPPRWWPPQMVITTIPPLGPEAEARLREQLKRWTFEPIIGGLVIDEDGTERVVPFTNWKPRHRR